MAVVSNLAMGPLWGNLAHKWFSYHICRTFQSTAVEMESYCIWNFPYWLITLILIYTNASSYRITKILVLSPCCWLLCSLKNFWVAIWINYSFCSLDILHCPLNCFFMLPTPWVFLSPCSWLLCSHAPFFCGPLKPHARPPWLWPDLSWGSSIFVCGFSQMNNVHCCRWVDGF